MRFARSWTTAVFARPATQLLRPVTTRTPGKPPQHGERPMTREIVANGDAA